VTTTPTRTCVGCGERAAQGELTRFVLSGNGLVHDPRRRLPGRGAWLHRAADCWNAFVQRRGAVRSLRATPSRPAREALRDALAAGAC
jgi:predicted RNA-binding protein YlxR (DUF448 family)